MAPWGPPAVLEKLQESRKTSLHGSLSQFPVRNSPLGGPRRLAHQCLLLWRRSLLRGLLFPPPSVGTVPLSRPWGLLNFSVLDYCFSVRELLRRKNSEVPNNNCVQKTNIFQEAYTLLGRSPKSQKNRFGSKVIATASKLSKAE